MTTRRLVHSTIAGLVGAVMLALPLSSASAFTLSSPSLGPTVGADQLDKVWWRGGWGGRWGWRGGWRGGGWGWRGGWGYRRWAWGGGWGYRPWGWGGGWGYRPWGWGGGWCRWHPYRCGW